MQAEYLLSPGQMMSLRRIDETIDMLLREKAQIYECAPVRYFLVKEEYKKIKESEKVMSMGRVIESIEREAFERAAKPQERLFEHRCSCGRLLGKFSGQAEVKCPKCGKVNVIGERELKRQVGL